MIKALIIDDEPSAIKTLQLLLKHYVPEITEVQFTIDPHEGIQLINSFQPDLLFLDIQMPLMTGFDLLKRIPQVKFNIIFTTAYDTYAIEAIRFSALDYLLKPIDADELQKAVKRFVDKTNASGSQALYDNFLRNISNINPNDFKLALPTAQGTFFFATNEIIRLDGASNYTKFYFNDNRTLLTSKTLKEYEEILRPYGFIRTHKSHLVNKAFVVNFMAEGLLIMSDNSKVEVSRRRKEEVLEKLKSG